jgi:ABC-type bacteriocin/lantibiotic exporter with double-glycine peptidase domain
VRSRPYTAPPFYPHLSLRIGEGAGRRLRAYRQVRDYTCGFASALTVLHAFRRYVAPEALYDRLGTDRTGTRQSAIVRELRAEGLSAIVRYDLEFDDIARHVDQGSLLIVYHYNLEHWMVVFGYARGPDRLLLADPWPGHRTEHRWDDYGPKLGGFGIVCRPPRRASAQLARVRAA